MKKKLFIILTFILGSSVWHSCEDLEDVPPLTIETTSLSTGDTLLTETISITLNNDSLEIEYRYLLDSEPWSDWSTVNVIVLEYLDEGAHEIQFQALRSEPADTSDILTISFVVDAVDGPSVMLYPRRHKAQVGDQMTFLIHAEEVANLMAAELHMEYDTTALSVDAISQGSFFMNGQESIFSFEKENGTISILTSIVNSDAPAVSGTGPLVEMQVTLVGTSDATISFTGNDIFRDPNNNDFAILERVNGIITVE